MDFQKYLVEANRLLSKTMILYEAVSINKDYLSKQAGSEDSYKEVKAKVDKLWNAGDLNNLIKKSDKILPFLYSQEIKKKGSITDKTMKFLHDLSLVNKLNILDKLDSDTTPEQFKDFIEQNTKDHLENLERLSKDEEAIWKRVKVFHKFDDGFEWVIALDENGKICSYIPSNVSFKTAGHCGNDYKEKDPDDQYFELRKNNKPYLTVIINDGLIQESKSYGNKKNKDADLILSHYKWLLSHEHVRGVGHRYNNGYAPDVNMGLKDFLGKDDEFIAHMEKTKPALMGKSDKIIIDLKRQLEAGKITEEDVIKMFKDRKIRLWDLRGVLGRVPFTEKELIEMINNKTLFSIDFINTDTKLLTKAIQHVLIDRHDDENLIYVYNEVPSAKIDMGYLIKKHPNMFAYINEDKRMSFVEEFEDDLKEIIVKRRSILELIPGDKNLEFFKKFKDSFTEVFKESAQILFLIEPNDRMNIIKEFKDSFKEGFKKDPSALQYIPKNMIMKFLNEFKDTFKEIFKKNASIIYNVPQVNKMNVFEMFKDSFKEAFMIEPRDHDLMYFPPNKIVYIVRECKDSFKEVFKIDPSSIKDVPDGDKLDMLKEFRESFKEGFKNDPSAIKVIYKDDLVNVLKMFKESFIEGFTKNKEAFRFLDMYKVKIIKDVLGL